MWSLATPALQLNSLECRPVHQRSGQAYKSFVLSTQTLRYGSDGLQLALFLFDLGAANAAALRHPSISAGHLSS